MAATYGGRGVPDTRPVGAGAPGQGEEAKAKGIAFLPEGETTLTLHASTTPARNAGHDGAADDWAKRLRRRRTAMPGSTTGIGR